MTTASGRILRNACDKLSAPVEAVCVQCDSLLGAMAKLSLGDFAEDILHITNSANLLRDKVASLPDYVGDLDGEQIRKLRHDLRTPINAIKGYGEMICEDLDEGEGEAGSGLPVVQRLIGKSVGLLKKIDEALPLETDDLEPADTGVAVSDGGGDGERPLFGINIIRSREAPSDGHILVVDDSEMNRNLLRKRLEREGHRIEEAANGEQAFLMMENTDYDLILLDLMMPGISGYEVLCRIKADLRLNPIPVIMISALEDENSVAGCIEAGAEDYLYKPFNPVILRARITACLERKRLSDQISIETERADRLLMNILPMGVINRLNSGEEVVADYIEDATVLFADIVGFTKFAAILPPDELVRNLNVIFSTFDTLVDKHRVEKIKIIGDAYMAVCGVSEHRADHAVAMADFALDMINQMKAINLVLEQNFQIRIGIHKGPLTAGVIGTQKIAFDIWGDTVNVASRYESYSMPNRINTSGETAMALQNDFVLEPRGGINMRGVGCTESFFLMNRK